MKSPCLSMLQIWTCAIQTGHLQVSFSSMATFVHLRPDPCLMRLIKQNPSISFSGLCARLLYVQLCVCVQILKSHSYICDFNLPLLYLEVKTKRVFPLKEWSHHTLHSLIFISSGLLAKSL